MLRKRIRSMVMLTLNPTLEHTCRMLASVPRLRLLRLACAHPGLAVFELARQAGVHVSGASQDLQRLHSCGLLQRVTATGERRVTYFPKAAPSIPNAAPILKAIQATFRKHPPARDPETVAIRRRPGPSAPNRHPDRAAERTAQYPRAASRPAMPVAHALSPFEHHSGRKNARTRPAHVPRGQQPAPIGQMLVRPLAGTPTHAIKIKLFHTL